MPTTSPHAQGLAPAWQALQQEVGQLGEPLLTDVEDLGQVTGPVNQPTLFGSSIKAQN